jgi:hypothetical protein
MAHNVQAPRNAAHYAFAFLGKKERGVERAQLRNANIWSTVAYSECERRGAGCYAVVCAETASLGLDYMSDLTYINTR